MPDFVTRGMEVDLKHVFTLDSHVVFDPTNTTIEIVHYSGTTEIIDLIETPMTRIKEGHFLYTWTIPSDFPENKTAFVYFRGTDSSNNRAVYEKVLRIVPADFFNGSNPDGLTVKFTKV